MFSTRDPRHPWTPHDRLTNVLRPVSSSSEAACPNPLMYLVHKNSLCYDAQHDHTDRNEYKDSTMTTRIESCQKEDYQHDPLLLEDFLRVHLNIENIEVNEQLPYLIQHFWALHGLRSIFFTSWLKHVEYLINYVAQCTFATRICVLNCGFEYGKVCGLEIL